MDSTSPHTNHRNDSGLLRFRSAPSSLLSNFIKGNPSQGSESELLVSRFLNFSGSSDIASPSFQEIESKSPKKTSEAEMNGSSAQDQGQGQGRKGHSGLPPHYPRHNYSTSSAMDGSYGMPKSFNSQLMRQCSSPAGLFSNISTQNGYPNKKGVYCDRINGTGGEVCPSMNRLKSQISFSSRIPSSSRMLSQISEMGSQGMEPTSPGDGKLETGSRDTQIYSTRFPYASWNGGVNFSENFVSVKGEQNNKEKLFAGSQNGESGSRVHTLSHHLSLPKTSGGMVAGEKFLHFQDSVPCKIRAKRGCATHPRSIAERVRRTRISERMRKLQELVPNMDKQTNTADMLDLAVAYINDLQKQFKTLSDSRAKCKCLNVQKPVTNQIV